MTTQILVVDDSDVERHLIQGLLIRNPEFEVELASSGDEALGRLAERPVDLVITDLMMPGMSGLELVREIRRRHPEIPAVLMTAYGDESIALDALEAGAASYVPKARQAERLMETVERVVDHAGAERTHKRLNQRVLDYHCRFCLENDTRLIHALVAQTQQVMADQGFGDMVERIRACEALEEALLNAMYHGNLELTHEELEQARMSGKPLAELAEKRLRDPQRAERRITVVVHLTNHEARFVVRDEGEGFAAHLPPWQNREDTFDGGARRGLNLIESLMDEVRYNADGNEITLRKTASTSTAV